MRDEDKYTIERSNTRRALPPEKLTGISWGELVDVVAKHNIFIAGRIRYQNPGTGGSRQLDGDDVLSLWKEVERKRKREGLAS